MWKADSGFSSFCVCQEVFDWILRVKTVCFFAKKEFFREISAVRHRTLRAPSSNYSSAVRDLQSISDPLSFRESSLTVPSVCNAPSRRRIVRAFEKYKSEILLVANCCVIILIRRRDDSPPVQKRANQICVHSKNYANQVGGAAAL